MDWHLSLRTSHRYQSLEDILKKYIPDVITGQCYFHLRPVEKHVSGIDQGHCASECDVVECCDKRELSNVLMQTLVRCDLSCKDVLSPQTREILKGGMCFTHNPWHVAGMYERVLNSQSLLSLHVFPTGLCSTTPRYAKSL